jgi:enoyl-CoA hydratase/carnithine racemase
MSTILVDRPADGVARVTFNRPRVLNAINRDFLAELDAALAELERDDGARSIILTGAGRAFSAGFDLKSEAEEGSLPIEVWLDRFRDDWKVFLRIWQSDKPYIAAVRGYNLGGSLELSLLCDVTIAAEGTKFGSPEIRHASGPGACMLPWLVGMKAAKYVLLTGDLIDAQEAWRMGFVTEVVPDSELDDRAAALASRMALIAPEAMKLHKIAINRTYERLGMLAAIQDNYMMTTVANGTRAYLQQEEDRQQTDFKDFVRQRDRRFTAGS